MSRKPGWRFWGTVAALLLAPLIASAPAPAYRFAEGAASGRYWLAVLDSEIFLIRVVIIVAALTVLAGIAVFRLLEGRWRMSLGLIAAVIVAGIAALTLLGPSVGYAWERDLQHIASVQGKGHTYHLADYEHKARSNVYQMEIHEYIVFGCNARGTICQRIGSVYQGQTPVDLDLIYDLRRDRITVRKDGEIIYTYPPEGVAPVE